MNNIIIEGVQNIVDGLKGMAAAIPSISEEMLDKAATVTKEHMAEEAPKRTGSLARSVTVLSPDRAIRVITPLAINFAPGNYYGGAVEAGSRAGYVPNPLSIAQYFGVDKRVAWAIALKIKDKGTPENPFVQRTYNWIQEQIRSEIEPFISQITAQYMKG